MVVSGFPIGPDLVSVSTPTSRSSGRLSAEQGVAVVGGAGRGIGRAIAEELHRSNWVNELVVADIRADELEQTALALNARKVVVDVCSVESIEALVAANSDASYVAIS